jgi:hypothetical protein
LQTDAENRAAAAREANKAMTAMPVYPGARESGRVPVLADMGLMTSGPPKNTVTRTRWWAVSSGYPRAVAAWYAAHPPSGFHTRGGRTSVSSSTSSGPGQPATTVYAADFGQPGADLLPPHGVSIEVETTAVPGGTAVRVTVLSVWEPARPPASYVQDVSSIDVHVVETHFNRKPHQRQRSFSVTDPTRVLRIATVFDSLPGYPPFVHGCPMIQDETDYRIVFHTATGDVTAQFMSVACSTGMTVARDDKPVPPALGDAQRFVDLLSR